MAHLILLGAGHAHLESLLAIPSYLQRRHTVTVVAPDRWLYYSGMVPSFFGGHCDIEKSRINVEAISCLRQARFLRARATTLDINARLLTLSDGTSHRYDVLSCNIGSQVSPTDALRIPPDAVGRTVFPAKPVEHLVEARRAILQALDRNRTLVCAVIGSGAAAYEIAGNLLNIGNSESPTRECKMVVDIYCDPVPLSGRPSHFRSQATHALARRGARFFQSSRVVEVSAHRVRLRNGDVRRADICFLAIGVRPPELCSRAGLATDAFGAMKVNRYLQSETSRVIFGGGDCIAFTPYPLDKVGVYAVRQNRVLAHNLGCVLDAVGADRTTAATEEMHLAKCRLMPFKPQRSYFFALNLGDGSGVGTKWGITIDPRIAFRFKERFDHAFVRHYRLTEHALYPAR